MEQLVKITETVIQHLGIQGAMIDVFKREDFDVVIISITHTGDIPEYFVDSALSLAHIVRELSGFHEYPLVVDINHIESKRLNRLQQTVAIIIDRVQSFDKEVLLPDVSSFDRMLVHGYIARAYPTIGTRSSGEGKDRHMTIFPKRD